MAARRVYSFIDMKTQYMKCRDWGHAWDALRTTQEQFGIEAVYLATLECSRCTTQKIVAVKRSDGERIASGYRYAENYLVADIKSWGGRRTFNANVRAALYQRLAETPKSRRRTTTKK